MTSDIESEDFESWLTEMPDALDLFISETMEKISSNLDYSGQSLLYLERWLLSEFPDQQSYKVSATVNVVDGVTRYVGETFRNALGGRWELSNKNPKDINFGLPVLTGYVGETTPTCPHRLVMVAVARRKGDFLHNILNNLIEDQKNHISNQGTRT